MFSSLRQIQSEDNTQNISDIIQYEGAAEVEEPENRVLLSTPLQGKHNEIKTTSSRTPTIVLSCSIFVSDLSCVQDEFDVDDHCDHQKQHSANLIRDKRSTSVI